MTRMDWDKAAKRTKLAREAEPIGTIQAKYDGRCQVCNRPFKAGDRIAYFPNIPHRKVQHPKCVR